MNPLYQYGQHTAVFIVGRVLGYEIKQRKPVTAPRISFPDLSTAVRIIKNKGRSLKELIKFIDGFMAVSLPHILFIEIPYGVCDDILCGKLDELKNLRNSLNKISHATYFVIMPHVFCDIFPKNEQLRTNINECLKEEFANYDIIDMRDLYSVQDLYTDKNNFQVNVHSNRIFKHLSDK